MKNAESGLNIGVATFQGSLYYLEGLLSVLLYWNMGFAINCMGGGGTYNTSIPQGCFDLQILWGPRMQGGHI